MVQRLKSAQIFLTLFSMGGHKCIGFSYPQSKRFVEGR